MSERHDHAVGALVQVMELSYRTVPNGWVYHDAEVMKRQGTRHLVRWTSGNVERRVWFCSTGRPVLWGRYEGLLMVAPPPAAEGVSDD